MWTKGVRNRWAPIQPPQSWSLAVCTVLVVVVVVDSFKI